MKHIFFVEDDWSLINGLSFALKKQGYELTIARTRVEAERLWAGGSYDLVILDVTLPTAPVLICAGKSGHHPKCRSCF